MLTDIVRENEFGYNSKKHLNQLKNNEAYLSESLVKLLEIPSIGGKVNLKLDLVKSIFMGGLLTESLENKGLDEDEKFIMESTSPNQKEIFIKKT